VPKRRGPRGGLGLVGSFGYLGSEHPYLQCNYDECVLSRIQLSRVPRFVCRRFIHCWVGDQSAHDEAIDFELPQPEYGASWRTVLDSGVAEHDDKPVRPGGVVPVTGGSVAVLQAAPR
jgi:hypothetical protein